MITIENLTEKWSEISSQVSEKMRNAYQDGFDLLDYYNNENTPSVKVFFDLLIDQINKELSKKEDDNDELSEEEELELMEMEAIAIQAQIEMELEIRKRNKK